MLMPSQEYDEYEWEAARAYARAVNTLDSTPLKRFLHKNSVYESQHVYSALVGRANILAYFNGKFATLSKAAFEYHAKAEMAWMHSTYVGRPAVLVHQGGRPLAVVLFKTSAGRIDRIDMCGLLPTVDEATGTGEFPE